MTSVIIGASQVEQIDQDSAALRNLTLPGDEPRRIGSILAREAAAS